MKSRELPPAVMFGGIAVVVLVVLFAVYALFLKPAPQIDTGKLTPQQLQDPDPPRTPR